MKIILLCALFAPIIYSAFRQKKWYLYLLCAFVGILPEQFSISIHESLPLITATRLLIVLCGSFWLLERVKTRTLSIPKAVLAFGIINVIISIINLRYGSSEINRFFLIIFERCFLIVLLKDMIKDQDEFYTCLDFMIMGCCALAVIGIVQTVFGYDIASVLQFRVTPSNSSIPSRMGMIRAYGTFNAISYGCYCAFMVLPIYYRLEESGKIWHSVAFALNFIALICTFTRSAWLCIGGMFLLLIILRNKILFKRILPSCGMIIVLLLSLCLIQPNLMSGLIETGKSAANTILSVFPDSTPQAGQAPNKENTSDTDDTSATSEPTSPGFELSEDFGANAKNPTGTRMMQWSAVEYMINEGEFLFGYGYKAMLRGKLWFFRADWGNKWVVATFLDVGLVSLITESGFVGAIAYLAFIGYLFIFALQKCRRDKELNFYRIILLIIPLYLLLNFLASFLNAQSVWLFLGLCFAYMELHKKQLIQTQQSTD